MILNFRRKNASIVDSVCDLQPSFVVLKVAERVESTVSRELNKRIVARERRLRSLEVRNKKVWMLGAKK